MDTITVTAPVVIRTAQDVVDIGQRKTPCMRCHRPMLTYSKDRHRIPGARYHCARGLCTGCYTIARRRRLQDWRRPAVPRMQRIWDFTRPTGDQPDPVVVDRIIAGERLPVTSVDLEAAVARLTACGRTARQIAETLGCTTRTVQRYRARARTEQAAA